MEPTKKFWLVWSPTGQTPPKKLHDTQDQARAEAQRLAIAKPGQEFYVLKAKDRYKKYADVYEGLKDFLGDMYPAVIGKKPEAPKFPEYLKTKTATEVDQVNQEAMKVLDKMISDAMRAPATPALGKTIEKLNDVVQEALDKEITNLLKKNPLLTTGDAIKATKKQIEDALFFGVDYGKAGGDKTVFIINPAKLPEGKTLEQVIEGLANQYPGCEIMVGMMDEAGVFECVKALNPGKKTLTPMEQVKKLVDEGRCMGVHYADKFTVYAINADGLPKGACVDEIVKTIKLEDPQAIVIVFKNKMKDVSLTPPVDLKKFDQDVPSKKPHGKIGGVNHSALRESFWKYVERLPEPKRKDCFKFSSLVCICPDCLPVKEKPRPETTNSALKEVLDKQEAERVADLAKAGKRVKVVVEPTCQYSSAPKWPYHPACDRKGGCPECKADFQELCGKFANWQG